MDGDDKDGDLRGPEYYFHRDFSWIAFNRRVLAQAEDERLPILDRVKFVAIVASNLDEFIVVRLALARRRALRETQRRAAAASGPRRAASADAVVDDDGVDSVRCDGMGAADFYARLCDEVRKLSDRFHLFIDERMLPALADVGIHIVPPDAYSEEDRSFLRHYFIEHVHPVLTPLTVDPLHPWPLLANGALYTYFRVRAGSGPDATAFFGQTDTVICQVPPALGRFVRLPSAAGETRVTLLEDVIATHANDLIVGYDILGSHPFRVYRDAELLLDQEQVDDLMAALVEELRRVRNGDPVRMIGGRGTPEDVMARIRRFLGLTEHEAPVAKGMLNAKSLFQLVDLANRPDLSEPPWPPVAHPAFRAGDDDIFAVLRERDVVMSLPYHKFDPVIHFIEQAAADPGVLAIKITLYRVSGDSPIVKALIRAAQEGKQVTALVELRARFDEEANIHWARRLDDAGAHVIYGVRGHKTHSKAALVVRREAGGIRRYCHLGTGNYNDRTARQYTDLGYFTSRPDFGSDLSAFFNVVTGYSLPPTWLRIEMAPTGLRRRLLELVRRETEKHAPESPGHIRLKMNSMTDPELIRSLYRAARAGVRIDLIVRGMCCLRPGVEGLSETITVRSIVDRYLEHPRIFHFRNGGSEELYLASADWMERNMDKRIELMFPVIDPDARRSVLAVLEAGFADNTSAWTLDPEGTYTRLSPPAGSAAFRSQQRLYQAAAAKPRGRTATTRETVFEPQGRPAVSERRRKKR